MSKNEHVDLSETEPTATGGYGDDEAASGIDVELPALDTFANQFDDYVITVENPEFTAICPKTGLPDFGLITITYAPNERVIELKSLKLYFVAYRNVGIFNENVVNRVLRDVVAACDPHWVEVEGVFTPRGGLQTTVTARWERED